MYAHVRTRRGGRLLAGIELTRSHTVAKTHTRRLLSLRSRTRFAHIPLFESNMNVHTAALNSLFIQRKDTLEGADNVLPS